MSDKENTKKCSCCKEVKPYSAFNVRRARPDGLQYTCKDCKYLHGTTEKSKMHRSEYQKTEAGILTHKLAVEKYNENNKDKQRARGAVGYALAKGVISRPNNCSECNIECIPQGHHRSYKEEHKLDVVWLCQPCHKAEHKRMKKGKDQ